MVSFSHPVFIHFSSTLSSTFSSTFSSTVLFVRGIYPAPLSLGLEPPAGLPWGLGLPLGINLGSLGQPSGDLVHTMEASRLQFGMQNNRLDITLAKQSKNVEIKVSTFFELLARLLPSLLFCIQKCSRLAPIV